MAVTGKSQGFWPGEAESPFAKPFREASHRRIPPVVVLDGLEEYRHHIIFDGSGRPIGYRETLDTSEVDRIYGTDAWTTTEKILLPPLEGGQDRKRAFWMDGARLMPPERL